MNGRVHAQRWASPAPPGATRGRWVEGLGGAELDLLGDWVQVSRCILAPNLLGFPEREATGSGRLVGRRVDLEPQLKRVRYMGESHTGEPAAWEELPDHVGPPRLRAAQPFDDFYSREFPSLVALARALTGSTTAEDIAQEAMIAAYRRWREIEQLDSPAAWVRRVCANMSTSLVRRRAAEVRALLRVGGMRHEHTELAPLDEDFWARVRRLPRRQAQAISLHYIYDLQVSDIAHTLGCSESSVKSHLGRGRTALSRYLSINDEGGS